MENTREIFEQFHTGCAFKSHEDLQGGKINHSFIIRTEAGKKFLLRKINPGVFKDPIKLSHNYNILDLYLKKDIREKTDYLFPEIYYSQKFFPFHEEGEGINWCLMEYFDNTSPPELPINQENAYKAARAYGVFQTHLLSLPLDALYTPIMNFRNLHMRVRSLKSSIKRNIKGRREKANPEINDIISLEDINNVNYKLIKSGKLKKVAAHNDPKPDNVLFDKETEKVKAVIDFDTIMQGYLIYDFGDMVRSFCSPVSEGSTDLEKVEIDSEIFASIAEGYLGELNDKLTVTDKQYLSQGAKVIIYMQAIRFLTDYLNGDIYYKTNYNDHNLDRCRNQLKLLENYIGKEKKLKAMLKKHTS